MSTTVFAAAAAANSGAAVAAANSARKSADCAASMPAFRHNTATVAEMQQYASCVRHIHPESMGVGDLLAAKVAVGVILACAAVGAVKWWLDGGAGDAFCEGLLGACVGLVLLLAIGAAWFVIS